MSTSRANRMRAAASRIILCLVVAFDLAVAQDSPVGPPRADAPPQEQSSAPSPGWRHFSKPASTQLTGTSNASNPSEGSSNQPSKSSQPSDPALARLPDQSVEPNQAQNAGRDPSQPDDPPPPTSPASTSPGATSPTGAPNEPPRQTVPSQLILKPGTFVTVRVNEPLSSDHSRAGDAFSATLAQPLVVNGLVVAQRGQTVGGRVTEAQKAGRVKGVSRLAVQLTILTLVDGDQIPVQTELIGLRGPKSRGRDAAAIAGTTAFGAAVGAAADWGTGAAIGAGAGALAATIGVLLTRGRPTVIHPESVLTFRIAAPVTISTVRAPQAFHYPDQDIYDQHSRPPVPPPPPRLRCRGYGCPPPPPPPPYWYYRSA